MTLCETPRDWENPNWSAVGEYSWRNQVGDEIRFLWPLFSPAQRQALAREYDRLSDNHMDSREDYNNE